MDLNDLYHGHGLALILGELAMSDAARCVHQREAEVCSRGIATALPPGDRQTYWARRATELSGAGLESFDERLTE